MTTKDKTKQKQEIRCDVTVQDLFCSQTEKFNSYQKEGERKIKYMWCLHDIEQQ